jgi:hypothetical protein
MDCKQISALIIWLVFYAAYIAKMILLRQQGIKGRSYCDNSNNC